MPTDTDALAVPGEVKLAINQGPQGQVSAMVPVSWCLSPDLTERLKEQGVKNPYMLIVISNGDAEVSRHVVPLTDLMTYIQFQKPGKNRIHGTVVWSNHDGDPKKVLTEKDDFGGYRCSVLERRDPMLDRFRKPYEGVDWWRVARELGREDESEETLREESALREEVILQRWFTSMKRIPEADVLDVEVSEKMFAKAPPKVVQWFVNQLPWERKTHDQCHFRRRLMTTIPLVLPWVVLKSLLVLAAEFLSLLSIAVLLIGGMRRIDYGPLRHPLSEMPWETWKRTSSSIWYTTKDDKGTSILLWLVNPATVSVLAVVAGLLAYFGVLDSVTAFLLRWILPIGGIIAVLATAAFVLRKRFGAWVIDWHERRTMQRAERQEASKTAAHEAYLRDLELLACSDSPRPTSFRELPKEHRTVRLRYLDLKAKVCKPFAS